jgi:2-polyprenyl-3-methyl-5-hydroxy-6-metoxy-1,4-benzoquinol methylase
MDTKKLEIVSKKPPLYERGDSVMWTDKYISKQLLEIHLNPDINLASRAKQSIDNTIEFISKFYSKPKLKILDLGCGPGLYAERLAKSGHQVTGIDFSNTSIEYATRQARKKNLSINYKCIDYLNIDYKDLFDLVLLVYTDFCVLIPSERKKLLGNIYKALKPDGIFIFDAINKKHFEQKFQEYNTWSFETKGFWKNAPYLELNNGLNYFNENVFLQQHIIIDQAGKIKTYRFWTHYFDVDDIINILIDSGFKDIESFENVLPYTDIWSGENITFFKAVKCE